MDYKMLSIIFAVVIVILVISFVFVMYGDQLSGAFKEPEQDSSEQIEGAFTTGHRADSPYLDRAAGDRGGRVSLPGGAGRFQQAWCQG